MPKLKLRWLRRRDTHDAADVPADAAECSADEADFDHLPWDPAARSDDADGSWAHAPRMHPNVISTALYAAILATLVIGVAAFVNSYSAQQAFAIEFGADERFAWLIPVMIDGAILASAICVIALSQHLDPWTVRGRQFIRRVEYTAAAVSVLMNGGHAFMTQSEIWRGIVAAVIGALAPLFLLAITKSVEVLVRAPRYIAAATDRRPAAQPQQATGAADRNSVERSTADTTGLPTADLEAEAGEWLRAASHEDSEAMVAAAADGVDHRLGDSETAGEDVPAQQFAPVFADPLRQVPAEFTDDEERIEWALWLRSHQIKVPEIAECVERSQATVYRWIQTANKTRPLVPQSRLVRAG
ncbi:DUF2637 domain-containing protein [Rhodococcus opacus]|uniref:DUF2637 domain-containing protein n=1 Tax=Rhodococcus opacus TaxID=37919 RepID=UPI0003147148|nr:DUF2637 domain-containing protein [Rhodococcus opacus]